MRSGTRNAYLLRDFADQSGMKAGEFFTPRIVVNCGRRADPDHGVHLDRVGDGVCCEHHVVVTRSGMTGSCRVRVRIPLRQHRGDERTGLASPPPVDGLCGRRAHVCKRRTGHPGMWDQPGFFKPPFSPAATLARQLGVQVEHQGDGAGLPATGHSGPQRSRAVARPTRRTVFSLVWKQLLGALPLRGTASEGLAGVAWTLNSQTLGGGE